MKREYSVFPIFPSLVKTIVFALSRSFSRWMMTNTLKGSEVTVPTWISFMSSVTVRGFLWDISIPKNCIRVTLMKKANQIFIWRTLLRRVSFITSFPRRIALPSVVLCNEYILAHFIFYCQGNFEKIIRNFLKNFKKVLKNTCFFYFYIV